MAEPVQDALVRVVLAWSPAAREVVELALELPAGSTVADALAAGRQAGHAETLDRMLPEAGVWGRRVGGSHVLRDGDRMELYRALTVDPKVARRERFSRQGARGTGLFARRRPGAKPGY